MIKKIIVASLLQCLVSTSFAQQDSTQSTSANTRASVVVDQKALAHALDGGLDGEDNGPDSEPSSFATEIEDTGTPGNKKVELNLFISCDRVNSVNHSCEKVVDTNIGIGEKVELTLSKSYINETSDDGQFKGKGPTEIGIKYRYHDSQGWSAAALVSTTRDDAAKAYDLDGNEMASNGTVITYMPLILTKKWNFKERSFTTTINAGYKRSSLGRNDDIYITGAAIGASLNEKTRLVGALAAEKERGSGEVTKSYRIGMVRMIGKIGKNYEIAAFGTAGRKILSTGENVTTYNFGFNIAPK